MLSDNVTWNCITHLLDLISVLVVVLFYSPLRILCRCNESTLPILYGLISLQSIVDPPLHNALFRYTIEFAYASLFGSFNGNVGYGGSSPSMVSHSGNVKQGTTLSSNLASGWNCYGHSNLLGDDEMGGWPLLIPLRPIKGWVYTHVLYTLVRMDRPYSTKFCAGPFTCHGDTWCRRRVRNICLHSMV